MKQYIKCEECQYGNDPENPVHVDIENLSELDCPRCKEKTLIGRETKEL